MSDGTEQLQLDQANGCSGNPVLETGLCPQNDELKSLSLTCLPLEVGPMKLNEVLGMGP